MVANVAINWLSKNEMAANSKKFQLMFLARSKIIEKEMSFVGKALKYSRTVELVGITLEKSQILNIILKIFATKQIIK